MPQGSKIMIDPIIAEALEALPDGVAIAGADGLPLFVNGVARRRFPTFYDAMERGLSYHEAVLASFAVARPHMSREEHEALADAFTARYNAGEAYESTTEDGCIVRVTYQPMSDGRRVSISVDVTALREREAELER